jgi:Phage integrase, N-terminal SAM-like domain
MTRRRVKGEGSVYRRGDGRVVGEYEDANGKRRYVSRKTKPEVRTKLRKLLADRDEGIAYDSENLTVSDFLDRWLETVKGSVRDRTWQRHEHVVRLHLKGHKGRSASNAHSTSDGVSSGSTPRHHSATNSYQFVAMFGGINPLTPCNQTTRCTAAASPIRVPYSPKVVECTFSEVHIYHPEYPSLSAGAMRHFADSMDRMLPQDVVGLDRYLLW